MSQWQKIWARSIHANQQLVQNQTKGEGAFQALMGKYPDDGMLYYSRGEGYECLGLWDAAIADYKEAERLLPAPHWKEVAKGAAQRVSQKRTSLTHDPTDRIWDALHRVYAASRAPHRVRRDALIAIEMFDPVPHLAIAILRCCLEYMVVVLLDERDLDYSTDDTLIDQINMLESREVIPHSTADLMQRVRIVGNDAIHHPETTSDVALGDALRDFLAIVECVF
jgi:tetratricopeptide (TPR) repeat protein